MFRNPHVYLALRRDVIPALKKLETVKIWHAGCATGEEVYSLAILLKEEGLYDRTRIYATDFNNDALYIAQQGIFPFKTIRQATANYVAAGGHGSFSDYYHAEYGSVKMHDALKSRIRFSNHNLATDGAFGDMDLILCRNVLIYFDRELQDSVFSLFTESLHPEGFLCLGIKETLDLAPVRASFDEVTDDARIYRHKGVASSFQGTQSHAFAGGNTPLLQGIQA